MITIQYVVHIYCPSLHSWSHYSQIPLVFSILQHSMYIHEIRPSPIHIWMGPCSLSLSLSLSLKQTYGFTKRIHRAWLIIGKVRPTYAILALNYKYRFIMPSNYPFYALAPFYF